MRRRKTGQARARLTDLFSDFTTVFTSIIDDETMDAFCRAVYEGLSIIRVYTKSVGKDPDFTDPIILPHNATVEDAARAIVLATQSYNGAAPVNLGSGKEITIKALLGLIVELTGFEGDIFWDTTKPDGQPRRLLDTSRALECFGFKAQTELSVGLRRTIDWYLQHRHELDPGN